MIRNTERIVDMPGFFISNFKGKNTLENYCSERCIAENLENARYTIKRNTLDKFMDDKLFAEDDDVIIVTEGVFLNKKELSKNNEWFETVKEMIFSKETEYFDQFRGTFSGAHYNKKSERWIVYSDAFGTKPVYYYKNSDNWIVASEVQYITNALKSLGIQYTPNLDAAYDILSYGFMTTDNTLVSEVRKVPYGCYLIIDDNSFSIKRYFDFNYCESRSSLNEEEIIEQLDTLFREAVRLEFEKDAEYGYRHICTLSGGLDSRMTTWIAAEMGYPMLNITFGQSDCMDEQIAKKVSKYLKTQLIVNTLDNGDMILAYEPVVAMNCGQSLYSGIAHSYLTLEKLNFNRYGLLHTGDVGDAIVGTIAKKSEGKYPGAYSLKLAHKAKRSYDGQENIEKFKMTTRGFMGVGASKAVCENYIYCISPFLYRDFFVFCLQNIPFHLRENHYIYKKWVLSKHETASNIPLQRYNGGLMTEGHFLQTIRKIKRIGLRTLFNWILYKAHIVKSLSRNIVKSSMNPFDTWYGNSSTIRKNLDNRFDTDLHFLTEKEIINGEFENDLKKLYYKGTTIEKTQVITVVEAFKQLHT